MKRGVVFLLTCLFVLGLFSTVNATVVSYEFSGSLYDMWEHDDTIGTNTHVSQSDLFDNRFSVGDAFTGHFTYETDSDVTSIYDGTTAIYLSALKGLKVSINDFRFSTYAIEDGDVLIDDNDEIGGLHDTFKVFSYYFSGDNYYSTDVLFSDNSATFTNDLLIPENLDLGAFDRNKLSLAFLDRISGDQLHLYGTIETLTPFAPVPVPATMLLFGIGLLGLAGINRNKT